MRLWVGLTLGFMAYGFMAWLCMFFGGFGHGPTTVADACAYAAYLSLPAGAFSCSRSPAGKAAFLALMACQYLAVGRCLSGLTRNDLDKLTDHGAAPPSGVLIRFAAGIGWLYLAAQVTLWGPFLWSDRVRWKRLELRWLLLAFAYFAMFLAQFAILTSRMRSIPVNPPGS